jgi:acetyl-CoA acetyltransferase
MALDVTVLGTGLTTFGMHRLASLEELALEAARRALDDAGLTAANLDLIVFANAAEGVMTGQEMIRGQSVLRGHGFGAVPVLNVENACASSSSATSIACAYLTAGLADRALVIGAEKISNADRRRSMTMFSTAVDLSEWPELRRSVEHHLLGAPADPADAPSQSALMDMYAAGARRMFGETEWTEIHAAEVAVKNRAHAAHNERAQFRQPIGVDDVLSSRMISDPLRLLMCSPLSDGAGAMILAAGRRYPARVRIRAIQQRTGGSGAGSSVVRLASEAAYEQAAIGPADADVVEVHDATATAELSSYHALGLCAVGDGDNYISAGAARLGGRQPVNAGGGLLSRGHPIGATGVAQLIELADQLRGRGGGRQVDGARLGLAQNSGGHLNGEEAVAVVSVMEATG